MKLKYIIAALFLFVFFPKAVFAQESIVHGSITDQKNNPVPGSSVVFTNDKGVTVKAALSDVSGLYTVSVPNGIYSISAVGPQGTGLKSIVLTDRKLETDTLLNFILEAPFAQATNKPQPKSQSYLLLLAGFIVFLIAIVSGFFVFWKKRKTKLPQPGSPD